MKNLNQIANHNQFKSESPTSEVNSGLWADLDDAIIEAFALWERIWPSSVVRDAQTVIIWRTKMLEKKISASQFRHAAQHLMGECSSFPTPSHVIQCLNGDVSNEHARIEASQRRHDAMMTRALNAPPISKEQRDAILRERAANGSKLAQELTESA